MAVVDSMSLSHIFSKRKGQPLSSTPNTPKGSQSLPERPSTTKFNGPRNPLTQYAVNIGTTHARPPANRAKRTKTRPPKNTPTTFRRKYSGRGPPNSLPRSLFHFLEYLKREHSPPFPSLRERLSPAPPSLFSGQVGGGGKGRGTSSWVQ